MTYQPRTLDELSNNFYSALLAFNSQLSDLSQGSVVYTLGRAIATSHLQQEILLKALSSAYYLTTAKSRYLDLRAEDLGITRQQGTFSEGYVLAQSNLNNYELQSNTVLTNLDNGQQYLVLDGPYLISPIVEVKVRVKSVETSFEANLETGSFLYNPQHPDSTYVVGSYRKQSGEICTPLSGGSPPEEDEAFRQRILSALRSNRSTGFAALYNILDNEPILEWSSIESPIPGSIVVWLDSSVTLASEEIARIDGLIRDNKAAGILHQTRQLERKVINLTLAVDYDRSADLDVISQDIIDRALLFINNLGIGQTLFLSDLLPRLTAIPGVVKLSITLPTEDVVPTSFSAVRCDDIDVSYDIL